MEIVVGIKYKTNQAQILESTSISYDTYYFKNQFGETVSFNKFLEPTSLMGSYLRITGKYD